MTYLFSTLSVLKPLDRRRNSFMLNHLKTMRVLKNNSIVQLSVDSFSFVFLICETCYYANVLTKSHDQILMYSLFRNPFLGASKSLRFGAFWAAYSHNSGVLVRVTSSAVVWPGYSYAHTDAWGCCP
jgi:hypothetical protein